LRGSNQEGSLPKREKTGAALERTACGESPFGKKDDTGQNCLEKREKDEGSQMVRGVKTLSFGHK